MARNAKIAALVSENDRVEQAHRLAEATQAFINARKLYKETMATWRLERAAARAHMKELRASLRSEKIARKALRAAR